MTKDQDENDHRRAEELKKYSILDTLPEEDYDNITRIASQICNTKISLISLLDENRQWFKSNHGTDLKETPIEHSFCHHAIEDKDEMYIVTDARVDEEFKKNPLVKGETNIVFYAGVPLTSEKGIPLGTLCVIDEKPKKLSDSQISTLKALAKQVINLLKLRKNQVELENSMRSLKSKNEELERFAYIAAHDIKSPLNNIFSLSSMIASSKGNSMDDDTLEMVHYIEDSSQKLIDLVNGLLEYSKADNYLKTEREELPVSQFKNDILNFYLDDDKSKIKFNSNPDVLFTNKIALQQILLNLIGNSIKYNDKETTKIVINITENPGEYLFEVSDNGPGIPESHQKKIFNIFHRVNDTNDDSGNGIGLATVKKLVTSLGGSIEVHSKEGEGATFKFYISK
ncbi:MAG: GAF domain-containing sensor histidine kinase [Salibacter sp.]|uniref:sensor histidine kinase n=1 Tax=Salibacter sp. TaxID=2010995 RepID=UPI00286FCC82|nr:GAF domain-containing sensor histidine kinase [Salibacter sp.]MDR9398858.1 GAF domain-containing sensor histidine kinase [Salibacter sp.]